MSTVDTVLLIIAAILFFIAGITPHLRPNSTPAINWVAWGLFCCALSALPFF